MPVISFKGLIFVIVLVTVAVIVNGAPAPGNTLPNKSSSAAVLAANLIRVHQVYQQQQPSSSVKPTQILVEAPSSSSPLRFTFKSQLETMDLPAVCPADATVIGITGNAEESIRISDISAASCKFFF